MRKARKSLAILLAVAMVFCMAPAMVFGAGDDGQVNRIAGNDRYITSAETALRAFESADTVLIARGDDEGGFADGLAASYLAGVENAPILLTEPNGLPPVVKDAISKLGAKKAIILGGPAVVSDKVKDDLAGLEVERIFGDDRFETAAKIAAKGKADTAFVVSGYAPADSLVAGPLAFSKNYPILLVGNNVPDFTSKALADLGIKNIYVIGGTGVVSESVYNDLAAKADQIVRYGGNDRVATSLEVAQNLYTNPVNFSIVGYDGLADAVGAAVFGNPILYTDSDLGISGIQSYLAGAVTADSNVNIFGGTGVVSNAAETALENIVPDELKVEIVSAIDNTTVEVVITALEEDLFGATIEVLDNKGNIVEVKPVDIPAGDTVVFFEFVKAVEKQEGVWKIAGHEYDFDLAANLQAFVDAGDDQIALNKALADLGIENVKVENMKAYADNHDDFLAELEEDEAELTVEAIQAWIDEVNADQISAGDSKAIAKKVNDAIKAENDVALLAALQDPAFVRVNAEWLADYKTAISGITEATDKDTVEEIQALINGVNNGADSGKVNDVIATISNNVDKDELLEAKDLITKYATPTAKGEQTDGTKAALKAIDVQLAVVDVLAATTPTTLKAKLTALDNLLDDADKFMEDYVDANGKYYLNGIKDAEGNVTTAGLKGSTTVKAATGDNSVVGVITTINNAIGTAYLTDVTTADSADKLLAALKAYPGLKNVADANKAFYFTTGEGEGVGNQFSTVTAENIQDKVDECNLEAVKGAADADKLLAALKVLGVKNIVDANKTAYYGDANNFAAVTADDVQSTLNDINTVVAVNSAKTADAMRTALAPVALADAATATDYLELTAAAKLEVADLFLAVKAGDRTNFTDGKYAAVADIDADLKTVTDDYKGLLSAVNTADSIAAMAEALGDLGIEAFDNLDAAAQLDAAEAFLNAFPKDEEGTKIPYTTLAAIEAALGL
jgi:putative cell wall-binding protein